jgi:hypothetical protein
LANTRRLDGPVIAHASQDFKEALFEWYRDGWLDLA